MHLSHQFAFGLPLESLLVIEAHPPLLDTELLSQRPWLPATISVKDLAKARALVNPTPLPLRRDTPSDHPSLARRRHAAAAIDPSVFGILATRQTDLSTVLSIPLAVAAVALHVPSSVSFVGHTQQERCCFQPVATAHCSPPPTRETQPDIASAAGRSLSGELSVRFAHQALLADAPSVPVAANVFLCRSPAVLADTHPGLSDTRVGIALEMPVKHRAVLDILPTHSCCLPHLALTDPSHACTRRNMPQRRQLDDQGTLVTESELRLRHKRLSLEDSGIAA